MHDIIASVLPIFFITLMGKFVKQFWLKSEEFWRGLESLSYYMLFPIVLFNYTSSSELGELHILRLILALIISAIILTTLLIFMKTKLNIDGRIFTSIYQGSIRYNSYIFFGLGGALYGKEGMEIVAVIAAYMIVVTNILSVFMFTLYCPIDQTELTIPRTSQGKVLLKNLVINPLILASIIGFLFNYFDIDLGMSIKNTLQTLSNSALAIGILCVGASLSIDISKIDKLTVGTSCLAKLIILPAITFLVMKIMGISGLSYSVGMLYSSLPTATNSYLLSKQLGGDFETMSTIITASIILSVLSLALLTYILG